MDLRKPKFKETVQAGQKAIGSAGKVKNIIPVEVRVFLKGVPNPIIAVVIFLVLEAFLGIGVTLYYSWKWVISALLLVISFAIFLKGIREIKNYKSNNIKKEILKKK